MPQIIFSADVNGAHNNVTGNSATYTIPFENVFLNIGTDYDGTDTFTAPQGDAYYLTSHLVMGGITSAMTVGNFAIFTSNRWYLYTQSPSNTMDSGSNVSFYFGCVCDMDTADIAYMVIRIDGASSDTADILGGTFAGFYIN